MGEGITLQMWQFILAGVGLLLTTAFSTWAIVKYLINRQDKQITEVMRELQAFRREFVPRPEYERSVDKLSAEMESVRKAIEAQGQAQNQSMNQLLIMVGKIAT